jgi:hypothetical protein
MSPGREGKAGEGDQRIERRHEPIAGDIRWQCPVREEGPEGQIQKLIANSPKREPTNSLRGALALGDAVQAAPSNPATAGRGLAVPAKCGLAIVMSIELFF